MSNEVEECKNATHRFFLANQAPFELCQMSYPFELPRPQTGESCFDIGLGQIIPASEQGSRFRDYIKFHAVGDTGTSAGNRDDDPKLRDRVIATMEKRRIRDKSIAFFSHLGDIVYDDGDISQPDAKYADRYKWQFEASFSMERYGLPKLAIPGTHDFATDKLKAFYAHFCDRSKIVKYGTGHQCNHYWKLRTPFFNFIGLSTNRTTSGWLDAEQISWLQRTVAECKTDYISHRLPLIVSMYYPSLSSGTPDHQPLENGSVLLYAITNEIYSALDFHPHLVLSGHLHNYQRLVNYRVPAISKLSQFRTVHIVAGVGGHENLYPVAAAEIGQPDQSVDELPDESRVIMEKSYAENRDRHHGFLEITVDKKNIVGEFRSDNDELLDTFTLPVSRP